MKKQKKGRSLNDLKNRPVCSALSSATENNQARATMTCSVLRLHGAVKIPDTEAQAIALQKQLQARRNRISDKSDELARSRTGDERKMLELRSLLSFWMVNGKPHR